LVRSHLTMRFAGFDGMQMVGRKVYVGVVAGCLGWNICIFTLRLQPNYHALYTRLQQPQLHTQTYLHPLSTPHNTSPTLSPTMSAVLSMQIIHALFPSLRSTSSSPSSSLLHSRSSSSSSLPKIRIEPAEDLELRPLLRALSQQPTIRHRRSSSASRKSSLDGVAPVPHVGFAMDCR
jgi:hypothetical protein